MTSPKVDITQFENDQVAYRSGNRVVLFRHGRWHFITLGYDAGSIMSINFMSTSRAAARLPLDSISFDQVGERFAAEVNAKVLPDAEAYRPLLRRGSVRLMGGFTSDTIRAFDGNLDAHIERIAAWMEKGSTGPYLNFT